MHETVFYSYPQYEWIATVDTPLTLKPESYERITGIGMDIEN